MFILGTLYLIINKLPTCFLTDILQPMQKYMAVCLHLHMVRLTLLDIVLLVVVLSKVVLQADTRNIHLVLLLPKSIRNLLKRTRKQRKRTRTLRRKTAKLQIRVQRKSQNLLHYLIIWVNNLTLLQLLLIELLLLQKNLLI